MKFTPRTTLLVIVALFLLPLVLAWLMYAGVVEFHPDSTRNKGILVTPAVPLDWSKALPLEAGSGAPATGEELLKHWVVLYPLEGPCNSDCEERLAAVRQVHLASGRQQNRIRLAVLFLGPVPADELNHVRSIYEEYVILDNASGELRRSFEKASASASPLGSTYLIDPLGHIMMVYPDTASPNDLKDDLKRLLQWSKLDEQ